MKKNVLYIHGYHGSKDGQSARLLRKHMPSCYQFYSIDYDENDASHALHQINDFVRENSIDVIVGSSLGGFLTLCVNNVCRVVYNPCYLPSVELPKIECDVSYARTYRPYERTWSVNQKERECTHAIFTFEDELLGNKYKVLFDEDWSSDVDLVHGPHKISEENIVKFVLPAIAKVLAVIEK